jgi:hypothetical protein
LKGVFASDCNRRRRRTLPGGGDFGAGQVFRTLIYNITVF